VKLYYSPFACSLASHIACREAGLNVELRRAELSSKRVEGGEDLARVHAMGQVPALVLSDGRVLTENAAVLTYLADLVPRSQLSPPAAHPDRYELTRWLSFVSTEIHKKGLWPIFAPDTPLAVKDFARAALPKALACLEQHLTARETLLAGPFTVADAYLFWALTILPAAGLELDAYPVLRAYYQRHLNRPAVRATLRFEREQYERPFAALSRQLLCARADTAVAWPAPKRGTNS
jgi:glutathione S-transferase